MAGKFVDEAIELISSPEGTPFSQSGVREYVKVFRLIANVINVDPIEACLGPGIPRQWSPYYSFDFRINDSLALCHTISAKREHADDWQSWLVTCLYSTEVPDAEIPSDQQSSSGLSPDQGNGSNNNPEQETPEYEWDGIEEKVAVPADLDGLPFLNSAQQPFKPAPTIDVLSPIFIMTRNESTLTRETLSTYSYAINTDPFMGAPPGYCQCQKINAKMTFKGRSRYWRATYRIKFHWSLDPENPQVLRIWERLAGIAGAANFSPFQPWILDQGVSELKTVNILGAAVDVPVPIMPAPAHPVLLDGAGLRAVKDAKTGRIPPTYIRRRTYKAKPFAKLFKNFNFPG